MLPCKKILSAIDFSEASFEALEVAKELALNFSAELLLVHVLAAEPDGHAGVRLSSGRAGTGR
ncbi:MAG: universal stress protein [Planctomycetota bacterium]|jgi:nucleotide-binding universal stress UspA family protein